MASMYELKNIYTLDEMLKLYSLFEMETDIENQRVEEYERR